MKSHLSLLLEAYAAAKPVRLHMPGHGGLLAPADVTELNLTDDLFRPAKDGAILQDEAEASELFGSALTLFFAGGATLALQTALAFQSSRLGDGARVYCQRGVHRSILHALALLDLDPVFVSDPALMGKREWEEADLLIFSGCDYFGSVPDYARLSDLCRKYRVATVVDNAHGTHLRFLSGGKYHPLSHDFDLVVDSAHKTLSCLTGASLLHVGKGMEGDAEKTRRELLFFAGLFSSTSPSFLILSSLADALGAVKREFDGENAPSFVRRCEAVFRVERAAGIPHSGQDPMRLVLRGDYDFEGLYRALEGEGIIAEFCTDDALVMLFPASFGEAEEARLTRALKELLPRFRKKAVPAAPCGGEPERVLTLREAFLAPAEEVEAKHAALRVAAEVVGRYPPGTALCMPGERLTTEVLARHPEKTVRVVRENDGKI